MAAHISVSDSLQTSILISQTLQQQWEQRFKPTTSRQPPQAAPTVPPLPPEQPRLGWCSQLLLTVSTMGMEMFIAFETVYCILSLQYLGVPVYLVSLNQMISGVLSMMLIPAIGYFTDKGGNAKRRKLFTMMGGGLVYAACPVFLIIAAILKILSLKQAATIGKDFATMTTGNNTDMTVQIYLFNVTGSLTLESGHNATNAPIVHATKNQDEVLSVEGMLGILGFVGLELGYEISMSAIRAFLLETVPDTQHAQILSMSTALAAVGGVLFSVLGIPDIPGLLETVFATDGMAAMLILLGTFLSLAALLTFGTSFGSGAVILSRQDKAAHEDEEEKVNLIVHNEESNATIKNKIPSLARYGSMRSSMGNHSLASQAIHPSNQLSGSHTVRHAPHVDHDLYNKDVRNLSISHASLLAPPHIIYEASPGKKSQQTPTVLNENEGMLVHSKSERGEGDDSVCEDDVVGLNVAVFSKQTDHEDERFQFDNSSEEQEHDQAGLDPGPFGSLLSIARSLSVSLIKPEYSPLGDFHTRKLEELQLNTRIASMRNQARKLSNASRKTVEEEQTTTKNYRFGFPPDLLILAVCCFFSSACLMSMVAYSANTLTIEIYRGDPTAPSGTEANANYLKGVRMASLGLVCYYCAYFVFSLANSRVIKLIGSQAQFLLANGVVSAVCVVYFTVKREELYFVTMATSGLHKCMSYSAPFLLAADYLQGGRGEAVVGVGRAMALLGFTVPLQVLVLGVSMGPLMDATGTAWVPMYYSVLNSALACLFMGVLVYRTKTKRKG